MDETSQIQERDTSIIDNGSPEKTEDRGTVPQKKIQDVCSNEGEINMGTNGIDAEELKPDYYDNLDKNLYSEPEISDKLNSTQPSDPAVVEEPSVEPEKHSDVTCNDSAVPNDSKLDKVVEPDTVGTNNGDNLSEEGKEKEKEEEEEEKLQNEESVENRTSDVVPDNEEDRNKPVDDVDAPINNGCENESEKDENVPSDKCESDDNIMNGDEDKDGKNKTLETEMVSCDDIDLSRDNESQENPSLDNIAVDKRTDVFEEMDVDQVEEDKSKDVEIEEIRHPGGSEDETITGDTNNDNRDNRNKDEDVCIIPDDVNPRTNVDSSKKKGESDSVGEEEKKNEKTSDSESNSKKDDESLEINKKNSSVKSNAETVKESVSVFDQKDLKSKDSTVGSLNAGTSGSSSDKLCAQCKVVKMCRFQVNQGGQKQHLCSDQCYNTFLKSTQSDTEANESLSPESFSRKCSQCHELVTGDEKSLSWETMEFCNEDCLGKYQSELGAHCANCKDSVPSTSMGKYCVRFGYDIKQFCTSSCLEEYKKGLKVCSYCQKDISSGTEGFLAPVGDKGQFKDFCTQSCMEKYERMSSNASKQDEIAECAVCSNSKPVKLEVEVENKTQKLCSEPCFAAFKFVNRITEGQCDMCKKYFDRTKTENFSIYYEDAFHLFCCKTCMNVYILANRKIVPCNWCKVKKYNFDMIKKVSQGQITMVCSLNCLMLYQVSVNAVSSRHVKCDSCMSIAQAQYHLTMSDATVRNFCGYNCVMSFQNQYNKSPLAMPDADTLSAPIPTGGPKRVLPRRTQGDTPCVPVISSVQSLASPNNQISASSPRVSIATGDVNLVPQVTPITQSITLQTAPVPAPQPPQIYQQIITKPPAPKEVKNKALLCKPYTFTKGVSCRPHPCMKETQTDESLNRKCLIPIPVPIFVPAPMHMWASPFPVPVPFPLPVPVPIFIPTTRNSAKGIFKEIKKIQEKIPTDPFEAELLMMAEMVAGDKKQDPTDSESDEGNEGDDGPDGTFSPENVDTSNTFGDDMLQMALKMATELEEPAVDMESVLTSNTITPTSQPSVDPNKSLYVADPDDPDQAPIMSMNRGRKRAIRGSRNSSGGSQSKRGRRTSGSVDVPMMPPPEPVPPPRIEVEKPDANMCLKYTFGVNAWRHWVMQKNAELEKVALTNRKIKLFKPELLQLTADELNFSLCLFVKEVRKPNGTEYAPDTIYYLCLGIQQYLFENGRIDNIFTDSYYEKFTDCLDEVAKKFAALYNDSQYIVTRVEEEHLWESKQLGAHSPHVLLSTLMFFNTKHFNLVTVEEHMQLSFSHIMKHWKRNPNAPGVAKVPGSRNVLLRFYPPQSALEANSRKKKVYEQQENEENPLRCPVKLYEFYLSKCPESVKTRNDVFYLLPERSCVPDSPVWYSTMALGKEPLMKMLHRVKMVKEINIALLTC